MYRRQNRKTGWIRH